MSETPLTDQVIDMMLHELKEKGIIPSQVYDGLGRVWPDFKATPEEVDWANSEYSSFDIEIDDVALTSPNDCGKWIAAWVWMPIDVQL